MSDTIECINGQPYHVKRYKQIVLDGTENWLHSSKEDVYKTVIKFEAEQK